MELLQEKILAVDDPLANRFCLVSGCSAQKTFVIGYEEHMRPFEFLDIVQNEERVDAWEV